MKRVENILRYFVINIEWFFQLNAVTLLRMLYATLRYSVNLYV